MGNKSRPTQPSIEYLAEFKPKNKAQAEAFDAYKKNDIMFLLGPAGTGKTHLAVYFALWDLFTRAKNREVNQIYLTRPIVEAGETLGLLPGDINEKVDPYMLPVYDCVGKMVNKPEQFIGEHFDVRPLAYMRGQNFENCVAILDEAQNCTAAQLKLFMTRLSTGGKLIISGDPEQSDIGRKSGLLKVVNALYDEPGIAIHEFDETQIVRHPLVARILKLWPK